jgi:hypothetical protein
MSHLALDFQTPLPPGTSVVESGLHDDEPHACAAASRTHVASFALMREFVEQQVLTSDGNSDTAFGAVSSRIDWQVIEGLVAHCASAEEAIGRAIVIADQMARGVFDHSAWLLHLQAGSPGAAFFSFSVTDAVPDFGDRSYRNRVSKRMGRAFRRWEIEAQAG